LRELRGRATVQAWQAAARAGRFEEVFLELMHVHYDSRYLKSTQSRFARFDQARIVDVADGSPAAELLIEAAASND